MRQQGSRFVALASVWAILVLLWWQARLARWLPGPPERVAELLISVVPLVLLGFGWLLLAAASSVERAARTPRTLPVRVEPREGGPENIQRWATWTAFLLVLFFSLAFALTVSLFPRTWDEAYECRGHGEGCNLVDATWYQTVLSVAAALALVGGLAAIPLTVFVVRDLRRLRAIAPPVVDLSSNSVTPGERLDVVVTLYGEAALEALTLAVHCLEEVRFDVGSSNQIETAVVYEAVLAERARYAGSGLVEVARSWTVPDEAMHSFRSESNQIRWYLSLRVRSGGHVTAENYDLEVRPDGPGSEGAGVEVPS